MVFLIIVGTFIYFMLPIVLAFRYLSKRDFYIKINNKFYDVDVMLFGWTMIVIEVALYLQCLIWMGVFE